LEGTTAGNGSPAEEEDVGSARPVARDSTEAVYEQPEGSLAQWYPAEHPFVLTATDTDDPRETPYACNPVGRALHRGDVRTDAPPLHPTLRLRHLTGPARAAPHGYVHNRGDKFIHFPITEVVNGQAVTRQIAFHQVVMNADPLVLGLVEDSEKVYSKPLYAEPQVREAGKPHYAQEDMMIFAGGWHDRPRLDRAISELRDLGLKAELHRYRTYAYEAERIEQRLQQLAKALGEMRGEIARCKFRL